jgi:hypothetical protein
MWTDEELDQALADQPVGPAFTPQARARALAALREAEAKPVRRGHRTWWAVVAAAAVVAVTAGTAVFLHGPPAADDELHVGPGQYFYSKQDLWTYVRGKTDTGKPLEAIQETVTEAWFPANAADQYLIRIDHTGKHRWLVGNDALVAAEGGGAILTPAGVEERRGTCGTSLESAPDDGDRNVPCDQRPGSWDDPTPLFIAQLPRDPAELHQQLYKYPRVGVALIGTVTTILNSPYADRDVRSALIKAMAMDHGTAVNGDIQTGDGRHGQLFTQGDDGFDRAQLVVDPQSGRSLGYWVELPVDDPAHPGVEPGTEVVTASEWVDVAAKIGVAPR